MPTGRTFCIFKTTTLGSTATSLGDPFYATYDVDYQRLVRERQLAAPDINPLNSFWSSTWFFCNPLSYDPARDRPDRSESRSGREGDEN